MTNYYSKCPHCGEVIKSERGYKQKEGSPFLVCNNCGKVSVDKEVLEPALQPYVKPGLPSRLIVTTFWALLFSLIPTAAIAAIFDLYDSSSFFTVAIISAAVLVILMVIHSIKTHDEYCKQTQRSYQASVKRMSNPRYAQMLIDAEFDVPERFRPTPEQAEIIRQEKEAAAKEQYIESMAKAALKATELTSSYSQFSDSKLEHIVKGSGYTEAAKIAAKHILEERHTKPS